MNKVSSNAQSKKKDRYRGWIVAPIAALLLVGGFILLNRNKDVVKAPNTGAGNSIPAVLGIRMVQIPAGSFMMGSNDGDNDEKLAHRVTLSIFKMSVTEITQG